jgi:hypothetical protein
MQAELCLERHPIMNGLLTNVRNMLLCGYKVDNIKG